MKTTLADHAADKAMKERTRAERLLWKTFEAFLAEGHPHSTPPNVEQLLTPLSDLGLL